MPDVTGKRMRGEDSYFNHKKCLKFLEVYQIYQTLKICWVEWLKHHKDSKIEWKESLYDSNTRFQQCLLKHFF